MTDTSNCNRCGGTVYWFTSKNGKKYPCASDNPRDFHKCQNQTKLGQESKPSVDVAEAVFKQLYNTAAGLQIELFPTSLNKDETILDIIKVLQREIH